tara:strand:+ start:191 stop:835 length:645 start_codon:yes stop_codon:yes gene_type:complete
MENIEQEIENKEVERIKEVVVVNEPVVEEIDQNITTPPTKSKKVRSQAQIDAFKKAQEKRKANILLKKESAAQELLNKKEVKKAIKEKVEEEFNQILPDVEPEVPSSMRIPIQSTRKKVLSNVDKLHESALRPIINNYYYSEAPPQKRGRKKKVIIESSSSEESSDEEPAPEIKKLPVVKPKTIIKKKVVPDIVDTPQDNPYQREINKLKFSYA